jgi:hypothetical protein
MGNEIESPIAEALYIGRYIGINAVVHRYS